MKRILMFILVLIVSCVFLIGSLFAEEKAKPVFLDYTGRYVLPEDSPVSDALIQISDDMLIVSVEQTSTQLEFLEQEKFSIPQFGGVVEFIRDSVNQVVGLKASIPSMEIEVEAKKVILTVNR